MDKKILKLAYKNFERLSKKYDGFINVIVDDWRGYRFIFDTTEVRNCKNNCFKCPLYNLLKCERDGLFSAGLYLASDKDKKFFGPQRFLNCKTLEQYRRCYINFLVSQTETEKEIKDEVDLIKNCKLIFFKNKKSKNLERDFKKSIFLEVIKLSNQEKREIIYKHLK